MVIASNFARARETAEVLLPALGIDTLEVDPAFGEHDPGPTLDGMSFVSYVERFGFPDWNGDPHMVVFPGGETTAQFHLRVGAALSTLVAERTGSTIVIVCHGGVIDAIVPPTAPHAVDGGFRTPDGQHVDHRVRGEWRWSGQRDGKR